jgi:hypothetical protein
LSSQLLAAVRGRIRGFLAEGLEIHAYITVGGCAMHNALDL